MHEALDPAADARRMAAGLREQAAAARTAVEAAREATYTAGVARGEPGEVTVVADGAGQVRSTYVGPAALRAGKDRLGATVARVLNLALRGAAERATEGLRQAAGPAVDAAAADAGQGGIAGAGPDLAGRLAAREGTGRSPGGEVAVAALGSGEITAVTVSAAAMRGGGSPRLGEQITMAANAALAAARQPQQELAATLGRDDAYAAERLRANIDRFRMRMDDLLTELDQAERRITGLD